MAYVTSSVLPVEDVPDGTSLLISGPPLTRKRELMVRLLGNEDHSGASLMVTTKLGAGKLLEIYRRWNDDPPAGQLRAVDCVMPCFAAE